MAEVQRQLAALSISADPRPDERTPKPIPVLPQTTAPEQKRRSRLAVDTYSPVNQNGSFEFDRVIKSGYVQKRTQKTKTWRTIYIVLRPNTLSIYKSDKEEKLRRKIYLSDLTAVTLLKDPKNKRQNVFGLFSPSKNYHFQAPTLKDAEEWVNLIRLDARIEEEEEEMFLASPVVRSPPFLPGVQLGNADSNRSVVASADHFLSTSPEPPEPPIRNLGKPPFARRASQFDSSGLSGTELASHSDFSDSDMHRIPGASFESLAVQQPSTSPGPSRPSLGGGATGSRVSGTHHHEADPDRVIWQGWMWFHRSKGGVRQWKKSWGVVRPRNLILYKNEAESSVLFVMYMSSIVNVVETDPMSRTKKHCLQIITDEKSYRFCAHDEEALVQCLGAFKSLLAKRRELEAKAGTTSTANANANAAATATVTAAGASAEPRSPPS
ncbi:PH-domain-containing protein [Parathielavia appendiculata]|uniref:PH-domain-containing protein n=1 Tax=Parathielavia appendiculata TaxID=2587402 RepID=A0AAN6U2F4_9PEZI|nr:PH-domain-containing protein [Parathielavia appendiculata]